jgi:2-iminobutanoate/2-iminopropanoate deaminase
MQQNNANVCSGWPRLTSACAVLMLSSVGAAAPTYIPHASLPGATRLPFSDAVLTGDTLYVAGHIGIDAQTGNAAADPGVEARLVMDALKDTVERAGLKMDDFVSLTVFCTDLGLYETFNAVYGSYFHGHHPARAFIGTDKLLRGAHFEVMGVAVRQSHTTHH